MSRMFKETESKWIHESYVYVLIIAGLIFALFPIFWIIASSFKPRVQIFATPPVWIFKPRLLNYRDALGISFPLQKFLLNSLIIGVTGTLISLLIGVPAAYSLTRFPFRGKKHISFWILSTRMAPPVVLAIPIFLIMRSIHLLDNYFAVVLAQITFNLPFVVWLMRGFLSEVPKELEDAALIDGCSPFQALVRIAVPLMLPGMAVAAVFCFIFSWNDFLFPLVLTGPMTQTVPVAITAFWAQIEVQWGRFMAVGTLTILPVIVFAIAVQKYLVRGLTLGAIK